MAVLSSVALAAIVVNSHAIVRIAKDLLADMAVALLPAQLFLRVRYAGGFPLFDFLLLLLRDLAYGGCGEQCGHRHYGEKNAEHGFLMRLYPRQLHPDEGVPMRE